MSSSTIVFLRDIYVNVLHVYMYSSTGIVHSMSSFNTYWNESVVMFV